METLKYQIKELETKIENTNNKYKIQSLKSKLGYLKAELKGNFVTVDDLKEFKGLVISIIRKSGIEDLKTVMTSLMNEKIVFKTRKGIKSEICDRLADIIENYQLEVIKNKTFSPDEVEEMRLKSVRNQLPSSMRN